MRIDTAELITRLNCSLFLGNFEMDFDDGELRFRTSIIGDNNITKMVLGHLIHVNIVSMDANLNLINDLIINEKPLSEVLKKSSLIIV